MPTLTSEKRMLAGRWTSICAYPVLALKRDAPAEPEDGRRQYAPPVPLG